MVHLVLHKHMHVYVALAWWFGKVSAPISYCLHCMNVTCWAKPGNRVNTRNHNSYLWPCHRPYFKAICSPVAEIQLETMWHTRNYFRVNPINALFLQMCQSFPSTRIMTFIIMWHKIILALVKIICGSSLMPGLAFSQGKGSGDYWVISLLYRLSSTEFEWMLITCLHDVGSIWFVMCTLKWRGTISLDCPKSRLLTQHNQEIAQ